mgnify:CR=1 FL=1
MGLSTMISKHNVAKQQKQNEEMRNRMATLRKKLVTSPSYKKLNSKDGDIPYAVNTEIMKQEVRDKTSELAQKAFWFSEKNAIIQEVKANNILLYFPVYKSFEKDKIKNWRRLEDAVFDPNNWLMLNAVKDTNAYKHLINSRDHIKSLASYFSNVLQIKPPKGALDIAKNLAQRAKDKIEDKREVANAKRNLTSKISNHKEVLSDFYNKFKNETDCLPPDFDNIFSDLKRALNGGKRGATDLNFDNFVKSYCKKLNVKEIRYVTTLIDKAVYYVGKNKKLEEQFKSESGGEMLNKRIDKVKRFHKFRFNCNFFAKLEEFYEECKLQYYTYLSMSSMLDLDEKFDYKNLHEQFPKDVVKLYGLPGFDKYHKELLEKVEDGRLAAKLVVNQEYEQTTDKTFNRDLEMFEKCRKKTDEFLDSMYEYVCKHPGQNVSPSEIPKSRADKVEALFDEMTKRLKAMRDNWKNLS